MAVQPIALNGAGAAPWIAPDGVQWYNTFGNRSSGDLLLSDRVRVDNVPYGQSPIVYQGVRANAARIACLDGDQYGSSSGSRTLLQWDKGGSGQSGIRFGDEIPGTEDWYAMAIVVPSGQPGIYYVFNEPGHPPSSLIGGPGGFFVQQSSPKLALNSGSRTISLIENEGPVSASQPNGTIGRTTTVWNFQFDTWIRIAWRCVWSITGTGKFQLWISETATMPPLGSPTFDSAVAFGGTHDTLQSWNGAALANVPQSRGVYRPNLNYGFTTVLYDGGLLVADSYVEAASAFGGAVAPPPPPPVVVTFQGSWLTPSHVNAVAPAGITITGPWAIPAHVLAIAAAVPIPIYPFLGSWTGPDHVLAFAPPTMTPPPPPPPPVEDQVQPMRIAFRTLPQDVIVKHMALPFRFLDGLVATNEQGTTEDVADCVVAVASFPVGYRQEQPAFGVPDQTFRVGGADPTVVRAALERWEPRAQVSATADNSELDEMVSKVVVNVARDASRV